MLLPLFVALFQTVADGQVPSRDARPVRVWLGSSGVLTRGTPVREDGSDGEGVLSDIVQRMLGDGYFNYDIAAYTVAPPVYAMQPDTGAQYPMYPTCTDCAFIGFQQNVFDSFALCDPFFSPCIGDGRFHHRGQRADGGGAPAAPSRTIALSMRGSSATAVIPRDGRAGGGG